jgi:hypothetical protein
VRADRREYGLDTWVSSSYPFGLYAGAQVLCSDGRVRKCARIASTADTFFSVPAAVKVAGKTVSGYVTIEALSGLSTETEDDPAVVKFVAYTYGKNGDLLPKGAFRHTE